MKKPSPHRKATQESIESCIEDAARRWDQCAKSPFVHVLRLTILRDLAFKLHAIFSKILAGKKSRGLEQDILQLEHYECRLEIMRSKVQVDGSLIESLRKETHTTYKMVMGDQKTRKSSVKLPEELYQATEKEKWQRFDRIWEASILAEALRLNWTLWKLQATVATHQLEAWHLGFMKRLYPQAIVLFAEAAAPFSIGATWSGVWYAVVEPS